MPNILTGHFFTPNLDRLVFSSFPSNISLWHGLQIDSTVCSLYTLAHYTYLDKQQS